MTGPSELLEGSDRLGWESLPFHVAEEIAAQLGRVERDRWIQWIGQSDIIDLDRAVGEGIEALDEAWGAVLRAIDAGWFTSTSWDELAAAGRVPLWCRIYPGYEGYFGSSGIYVTAALIALTSRWAERAWGSRWRLPEDHQGERSLPVLSTPGGRGLELSQLTSLVHQALVGTTESARRDDECRKLFLSVAPDLADTAGEYESDDLEGPAIAWQDGNSCGIGFSDLQAYDEDERIDRFVTVLAATRDIAHACREDRELVVVQTGLSQVALMALIDTAWDAAAT